MYTIIELYAYFTSKKTHFDIKITIIPQPQNNKKGGALLHTSLLYNYKGINLA